MHSYISLHPNDTMVQIQVVCVKGYKQDNSDNKDECS